MLIGDILVRCEFAHRLMQNMSVHYLVNSKSIPDIELVYDPNTLKQVAKYHKSLTIDHCERVYTLQIFATQIIKEQAMVLHASVVVVDDRAVIFCGKRNVGKSTQAKLWLEYYDTRAKILADDFPLVFIRANKLWVGNTPWSKLQCAELQNRSFEVLAVCFLQQSSINRITELPTHEAINTLRTMYPTHTWTHSAECASLLLAHTKCYEFKNNADINFISQAKSVLST